jgi:hypothetical protein
LHAEIHTAVGFEHIKFFKTPLIEQQINPFARSEFSLRMLRINPALTAAHPRNITSAL